MDSVFRSAGALFTAGLVGLVAARCSSDKPGSTAVPDGQATARCEVDLAPYVGEGGFGASAHVASAGELLTGEAATGREGDVLLANDRIRVVIEQPGRSVGPQPWGGNIIDADVVRPGETGRDRFGELGSILQFGRTLVAERVEILRDGGAGGAAIVAATGRDGLLDWVHLSGLVAMFLPGLRLPDPDVDLHLRVTKYYVLRPGSNHVTVVDAYCNESAEPAVFAAGDLVDSGGQVQPYGGRSGFAAGAAGAMGALSGGGEPFVGWIGQDVAYGLVPDTDRNAALIISGVTATIQGSGSLLDWVSAGNDAPEGAVVIEPGSSAVMTRDFVVAHGPGELWSTFRELRGETLVELKGSVTRGTVPVEAARVVVLSQGKVVTLLQSSSNGSFSGRVPAGDYLLSADDGITRSASIAWSGAAPETVSLELPEHGVISLRVRNHEGEPMPGKATIVCRGDCAFSRTGPEAALYRDVDGDALPKVNGDQVFEQLYLGPDGDGQLPVPPGDYVVHLSRGNEYALFTGEVSVAAGGMATVEGHLGHVVDTAGWMSGDFHVHSLNSPDSPVANVDRIRTFLAEGLEVLVATDHDFISDLAPDLARIPGGDRFIRTVPGVELTTFDYGHSNAFPLVADPSSRNGGAVDWAGGPGPGPGFSPRDIHEALQSFPGEQVVQVNHARGGEFSALELDTRTLWTRATPESYRIHAIEADPQTGDTRLFDGSFTAMEVQNGFGVGWVALINDWMSLMSRGLMRTATAVSDTHKRHGNSGYPRTYVRTSTDDPSALDLSAFARAVNERRAIGTNGPFVSLMARTGGAEAGPGDTLQSGGQEVEVEVEVRTPEWMEVDTVRLFVNAEGTATDERLRPPTQLPEASATLTPSTTLVDVEGGRARRSTANWRFTPGKDAWIVAVVTGSKDLFPVVGKGGVTPLAFTNAVLVDVDGGGFTPPVDLAAERTRVGRVPSPSPLRSIQRRPDEAALRRVLAQGCGDED